jgi:hypothetical protein
MLSSFLVLLVWASATKAQTPGPAATGSTAKSQEGFTPGWGFGMKFEGSSSGDGTITDLATGVGYNFSHHFGVDLGVPYYFVGTPSSIKNAFENLSICSVSPSELFQSAIRAESA